MRPASPSWWQAGGWPWCRSRLSPPSWQRKSAPCSTAAAERLLHSFLAFAQALPQLTDGGGQGAGREALQEQVGAEPRLDLRSGESQRLDRQDLSLLDQLAPRPAAL